MSAASETRLHDDVDVPPQPFLKQQWRVGFVDPSRLRLRRKRPVVACRVNPTHSYVRQFKRPDARFLIEVDSEIDIGLRYVVSARDRTKDRSVPYRFRLRISAKLDQTCLHRITCRKARDQFRLLDLVEIWKR